MKGKCLNSGKGQFRQQRGAEKVVADQVTWGYLIWVRLNGGSWWPAQVFEMLFSLASSGLRNWYTLRSPVYRSSFYLYQILVGY